MCCVLNIVRAGIGNCPPVAQKKEIYNSNCMNRYMDTIHGEKTDDVDVKQ